MFRGRLVLCDELRGGICSLGRSFHLVGSLEGGICQVQRVPGCDCGIQGRLLHLRKLFFKSRGRFDGATGFRGRHFSRPQDALSLQNSMGGIFSKGCHFSERVSNCSSVITNNDERRGAFGASKTGRPCLPYNPRRHRGGGGDSTPPRVFRE